MLTVPKTGTLPAAPRARFPSLRPPIYDSSSSTSPFREAAGGLGGAEERCAKEVLQTIGGGVRQAGLRGRFPDRPIQFKERDLQEQRGERNLRPVDDPAFSNTSFTPTSIARAPLPPDTTRTSSATMRTCRVRPKETVIPKLSIGGRFIMGIATRIDERNQTSTLSFST